MSTLHSFDMPPLRSRTEDRFDRAERQIGVVWSIMMVFVVLSFTAIIGGFGFCFYLLYQVAQKQGWL